MPGEASPDLDFGIKPPAEFTAAQILDEALASAREHKRIADARIEHEPASAAPHYLAAIAELAFAVTTVVRQESE